MILKRISAIALPLLLAACATRGELAEVRREQTALAMEVSKRHVDMLDRDSGHLMAEDRMEIRLKALEERLRGPWENPDCENYSVAGQKMFCRRKETIAGQDFDAVAERISRAVDASFCRKATEPWQVRAFCVGGKKTP